jgi:hypothetical protein
VSQISNGGFLQPCTRGCGQEDTLLGEEQLLGFIRSALEDGFEFGAAVGQHRLGLSGQDFRFDIDGTGNDMLRMDED